jgi:hypothetical protein
MLMLTTMVFAQQKPPKYALVIGNRNYTGNLNILANPVNDANDITIVLEHLGFTVDKVLNGNLAQMEEAVIRLKNRLSTSKDAYGFFFYAGHGVQSGGENFLIPVDANIPSENYLRNRALSVQVILDDINDAGNGLNVVILDACRDNPFTWSRGGSRGLAMVSRQPAGSIIVYATSAGQQASDGEGRNGLFTSQLLGNLATPGIEVKEIFNRTGADVAQVSNNRQVPAIYSQFFRTAYLGDLPYVPETGAATGWLEISAITAGTVRILGASVNQSAKIPALGSLPIEKIDVGRYLVIIEYEDGSAEEKTVTVGSSALVKLEFDYKPAVPMPLIPGKQKPGPKEKQPLEPEDTKLWTVGASAGTALVPMFVGTVYGTIAPFRYSFLEIGMDIGGSYEYYGVNYFSLYPYTRYALFAPFARTDNRRSSGGFHAGIGMGVMISSFTYSASFYRDKYGSSDYRFDTGKDYYTENIWVPTLAFDTALGVIVNGFTLTYSLRTDFAAVNHKIAVGYSYRF